MVLSSFLYSKSKKLAGLVSSFLCTREDVDYRLDTFLLINQLLINQERHLLLKFLDIVNMLKASS